jgi:polysaccharide chain length determinant protein (PEP-CTERM system associated)
MGNPTLQLDDLQNLFDSQSDSHQESQLDIGYYINLVLRRRWFVIIPFFIALIAGIYLAVALPKKYQAETLILIEPQRVPDNYVQAIVSSDLESRIATLKETILSRTNLLKIIEGFNLFNGPESPDMFLDEKIEIMRKRTAVNIVSDRGRTANAFKITFEAEEPRKVMQVVNAMATLVIDQNLKVRESQAVGTVEFLEQERVKMRGRLEEVEATLKDFREVHMGELPSQLASNLMVLERLQQQLSDKQKSIRDEKNRLSSLENQLQFAREQAAMTVTAPALPENREPTTLEGLKQQLADYKIRYTPQHPDVIRLQRKIEELEKESPPLSAASGDGGSSRPAGRGVAADLIAQRNSAAREIVAIRQELSALQEQIAVYQRRVEDTPKLEQELLSLERDYSNTQKTYESLSARKQEAEVAANMERQQKGEQFRILDPARLPDKPQSPDMRKLFLMCVMAGLGLGGGLIFLLEFLDKSVKKLESVPKKLGIPLLAVPKIDHPQDVRKRRLNDGLSIAAAGICMALMALFAAVSVLGMQGPTEMVKRIIT